MLFTEGKHVAKTEAYTEKKYVPITVFKYKD